MRKLNRRRLLVTFAVLLICLSYLGAIFKLLVEGRTVEITHMPNRHLVATTLATMTAVLYIWQGITLQLRRGGNVSVFASDGTVTV